MRVPLHDPAAGLRNQIHCATKSGFCHSFAPVLLVHEDARDPVVGRRVQGGLVLLAVVDVRQFLRAAVLAPRHCLITVEHQRSVCAALLDQPLLEGAVPSAVNVFSAWKVWNQVHQQPPNTPLCLSTSRANASQVFASSGLTT